MEKKSIKQFFDELVTESANVIIHQERHSVGSTSLLLYMAVSHANAGRKVLLFTIGDDTHHSIKERIHKCISNTLGTDEANAIRQFRTNLSICYLPMQSIFSTPELLRLYSKT